MSVVAPFVKRFVATTTFFPEQNGGVGEQNVVAATLRVLRVP